MTDTVGGISPFDPATEHEDILKNIIATISGLPTTGKTETALGTDGPRYFVSLDPNPMWKLSVERSLAKYPGDVFPLRFDPMEYVLLTPEAALERFKKIEAFGRAARAREKGGTFILDGGTMFKGYLERAYLGESVTLGWRPKKGEKDVGIGTYQYATRNAVFRDFLAGFVGSDLDVLVTFEGRFYNGVFSSTMTKGLDYIAKLPIETAVVTETTNGVTSYQHMMVVGQNPYLPEMSGYAMKLTDWKGIRTRLAMGMPDLSEVVPEAKLQRINTEVIEVADAGDALAHQD